MGDGAAHQARPCSAVAEAQQAGPQHEQVRFRRRRRLVAIFRRTCSAASDSLPRTLTATAPCPEKVPQMPMHASGSVRSKLSVPVLAGPCIATDPITVDPSNK